MILEALKLAREALYMSDTIFYPKTKIAIAAVENAIEQIKQAQTKPTAWLVEFENGEQELHFEEQPTGETNTPLCTFTPQTTQKQEPYATEEESAKLIQPDTRSPEQKKADELADKNWMNEQGHESSGKSNA